MNTYSVLHKARFAILLGLCLLTGAASATPHRTAPSKADPPCFLKAGRTYRIKFPAGNDNPLPFPSYVVKFLENGGGGWLLVESSNHVNRDGKDELLRTRVWLNFAYVMSAAEEAGEDPGVNKATPKKKP